MAITKLTFNDLYETMNLVCKKIDTQFDFFKTKNKGKKIYSGFGNYKDFLHYIESTAIKETAKELKLTPASIKDRWKIMTLPLPVYDALEKNEITMSKLKPLLAVDFDVENDKDMEIAEKIVEKIKSNIKVNEIKQIIKEYSKQIWNSSTVLMELMAKQNNIDVNTIC